MPTLLRSAGNNIRQTLNGAINSSVLSVVLTDGSTLNTDGGLIEITYNDPDNREVMYYLSRSSNTLTIADDGRGLFGTTATSHLDGALVRGYFVDDHINNLIDLKAPLASPTFTGTVTLPTGLTGVVRTDSGVVSVDTDVTDIVGAASTIAAGKIELATTAETETGTATDRAVTPDGLHDMTTLSGAAWLLDEDDMATDSAVKVASQQSVKAYTDTKLATSVALTGWIPVSGTWAYASADDPTFTFTIAGDWTAIHSVGMKVKLTQTTVKYFIITKMAYAGGNTTYTIYGGTDYDLVNAAITSPYISNVKTPVGFPLSPFKWSVNFTDSSSRSQTNPTSGTWYNLGTLSLSIPIGIWRVSMKGSVDCGRDTGGGDRAVNSALSTSNNSVSHAKLNAHSYKYVVEWNRIAYFFEDQAVDLSSKTTFYPIFMASGGSATWYLRSNNDQNQLCVQAECVYL